ncbi:sugar kinase [Deinococcus frigens]|uniref:sugar kinase n=1 Tax=Deinococcus frigens TaxID=249403 RepID=UPI000496C2DE|nr:sugar kinase [Deinococcus frigens]
MTASSTPDSVLTFGEVLLKLRLPQGDRLESMAALHAECAGSELNVAATLRALGRGAAWISALPSGPLGDWARAYVNRLGVDDLTLTRPGRLASYLIEDHLAPRRSRAVYDREHTAFRTLQETDFDPAWLTGRAVVHTCGISLVLGDGPRALALHLLRAARDAGVRVSLDVNHRRLLLADDRAISMYGEALALADIIFTAMRDASLLGGVPGLRALNTQALIVVTHGARGSEAHLPGGEVICQPAFAASGPGRIGRGDAFAGGFLHAWLGGAAPAEALRYATACAALKTTLSGDHLQATPADVQFVLAGHDDAEPVR